MLNILLRNFLTVYYQAMIKIIFFQCMIKMIILPFLLTVTLDCQSHVKLNSNLDFGSKIDANSFVNTFCRDWLSVLPEKEPKGGLKIQSFQSCGFLYQQKEGRLLGPWEASTLMEREQLLVQPTILGTDSHL